MRFQRYLFLLCCIILLTIPGAPLFYRIGGYAMGLGLETDTNLEWREQIERAIDEWLGLSSDMIKVAAEIRKLGGVRVKVVEGKDGWLYLNSGKYKRRVAGAYIDHFTVGKWFNNIRELSEIQKQNGGKFLFVAGPDKSSIYPQFMPEDYSWDMERANSLDEMFRRLSGEGIEYLDLRPHMRKLTEKYQLYDEIETHWNYLGALIAYNEILKKLGLDDLVFDLDKYYAGMERTEVFEDMLVLSSRDPVVVNRPSFNHDLLSLDGFASADTIPSTNTGMQTYRIARTQEELNSRPRPRIVVIGDSFTYKYFRPFLARTFKSVLWQHHLYGKFDREMIREFAPDYLVFETVERNIN